MENDVNKNADTFSEGKKKKASRVSAFLSNLQKIKNTGGCNFLLVTNLCGYYLDLQRR